jgi:hypothetical protein
MGVDDVHGILDRIVSAQDRKRSNAESRLVDREGSEPTRLASSVVQRNLAAPLHLLDKPAREAHSPLQESLRTKDAYVYWRGGSTMLDG